MGMDGLLTAGVVMVLACAYMAHKGFRGRVHTVGVDLGTTFSVVGVNLDNQVRIVADKQGRHIFPSVVSYLPDGGVVAAHDAVLRLGSHPLDTIYNSKRFIGRSLEDEGVLEYASAHPFAVRSVGADVSAYGQMGFQLPPRANGQPGALLSPEGVGADVLRHLLRVTADYLGYSQVTRAVIAVPAKFNAAQRAATGAAFAAAGLKVARVLEEPTAAAVAYQLHKKRDVQHILVYDFGGGTLDVSILHVHSGSVEVYATDGDDSLGGGDFDLALARHLQAEVEAAAGRALLPAATTVAEAGLGEGEDAQLCSWPRLRLAAEEAKRALSSAPSATVRCSMGSLGVQTGAAGSIAVVVSRARFEAVVGPLLARSLLPVTRLLGELGMQREEIDEVVLVGGSTRLPQVKAALRAFFGKELNDHIDPDITVAYGAASIVD